jgi:hypothetical protein
MSSNWSPRSIPLAVRAAAIAGVGWNAFGVLQFAGSVAADEASLIASGLTPEQASVMAGHPVWMTVAFAVGVFGGLAGSVLLFWRHPIARPVLAASLVAYIALWIGDAVHGVFAALGAPQVAILSLVVAIAAGLWLVARAAGAAVRVSPVSGIGNETA